MPQKICAGALAVFLAFGVRPAMPQESAGSVPGAGDRVRYRPPGVTNRWRTGTVIDTGEDSLVVRPSRGGEPVRLLLSSPEPIQVARGRRSLAREGALIGFVPTAILGGLLSAAYACSPSNAQPELRTVADSAGAQCGAAGFFGGAVLGATTAAIGALVGLNFSTDRWQPANRPRMRGAVNVRPGGVMASVAVSF